MNDLITAATSGLFVEVGKVIEHMKAQQGRIAELERQLAEASAPAVEQQPVAYLRFRAAQQWSGVGGHDIEHNEWLETCHAHEIGDDKMPAFPVYAAPHAADTDKVREAIPDGCALGWNGTIYHGISEIYHQMEEGVALHMVLDEKSVPRADKDGCVYSLVGRVEQYVAASMAAQAPVREVPEGDGLTGKWCYSTDGEEFQGQCDTEQEAHAEACEYVDSGQAYWIGQIKHPADCIGSNRSVGDDIITRVDEAAYEECGGDDRAFEFSHEQCEQLGAMVREFIRREGSVNRWAVVDSKQYEAPAAPIQQEGV